MAKYIPDNWRPSVNAQLIFNERFEKIQLQVRIISNKFRMNYPSQEDFQQEGLIAALYAIDTYTAARGKLEAYIQTVAYNGMAMVACEAAALRRAPKVIDAEGRKVSAFTQLNPEMVGANDDEPSLFQRERELEVLRKRVEQRHHIEVLKAKLTPEARLILDMKLNPPLELHVLSRNLHGRNKLTNQALSKYTGMTVSRVEKSLREIRTVAQEAGVSSHV